MQEAYLSPETAGSSENLKEKVPVARRRRRMRAKSHIPPLTSTDISDLVPEGRWTPEYLAAMQKADGDLGQLLSWKLGDIEKPDWNTMRGCSPALKAH